MKKSIVHEKSYAFAIRIVNLYKYLIESKKEFTLARQVLKSGTAIGALVREGEQAESKADFIHKNMIALKEARETNYWLRLLIATEILPKSQLESLTLESEEIMKIIGAIVTKAKMNEKSKKQKEESNESRCFYNFDK